MKKTIAILLCAALMLSLAACANTQPAAVENTPQAASEQPASPAVSDTPAPVAEPPATPDAPNATKYLTFNEETPLECDLDGDGATETIIVTVIPEADYLLEKRQVTVTPASGEPASLAVDIVYGLTGFACDVDNDGVMELLVSGDMESCDYATWLMRYANGELMLAESPYDDEESGDWLPLSCSGVVMDIDNGVITVEATVDILGTWGAKIPYRLSETAFALERVPGSVWTRDTSMLDPEYWGYCTLITTRELPVTFDGESAPSTLEKGVKLATTQTDLETYVGFVTEDGREGRIAVVRDTENWGWLIDGINESEFFEVVPYAG